MFWDAPTSSWSGLTDLGVVLLTSVPRGLFTQAIGEPVGGAGFLPWLFYHMIVISALLSSWAQAGHPRVKAGSMLNVPIPGCGRDPQHPLPCSEAELGGTDVQGKAEPEKLKSDQQGPHGQPLLWDS